jgi:organic radical activating enzyme
LQRSALIGLARELVAEAHEVEVETNGTISPAGMAMPGVRFNVSPKLSNAEMPIELRIRTSVLDEFAAVDSVFKFVVKHPKDLEEVAAIVEAHNLRNVWISPESKDRTELVDRSMLLAQPVVQRGWSLSPRLHILIWGNERGR